MKTMNKWPPEMWIAILGAYLEAILSACACAKADWDFVAVGGAVGAAAFSTVALSVAVWAKGTK